MKSAGEIKKGLNICLGRESCVKCPYEDNSKDCDVCQPKLQKDSVAYIRTLENMLHQAVEDIRMLGRMGANICPVCAYYNHGEGAKGECVKCLTGDGFRWRGSHGEHSID